MEGTRVTHKPAQAARLAPFPKQQFNPFTFTKRASALYAVENLFGASLGGQIPPVEVLFSPPTSGSAAGEYAGKKNPEEAFRTEGPISWHCGRIIYFNAWKLPATEEKRKAALEHEMAHVLLAVHAGERATERPDRQAYICAAEGIATFAEIESRHASGIEWKGFPEGTRDEYILGFAFFNSIREAVGTEGAFQMIASHLPTGMDEIRNPQLYLGRVASEHDDAQAVA